MSASPHLRAAVALIGFTAAVAQIVLMRELMVVFAGNEVSIGLALAAWLLWTAAGSAGGAKLQAIAGKKRGALWSPAPARLMAFLEVMLALALPLSVEAVRASKRVLESVPGESLGPASALMVSFAALSAFCLLSGSLFSVGGRLQIDETGASTGEATGFVYLLEAVGSAAGGALAGLALVRFLGGLQIACLLSALNLLAAAFLTLRGKWPRGIATTAIAALSAFLWLPSGAPAWERASLQRLWPGYRLLAARNSAYGSLAVLDAEGARSLYENGLLLSTDPDPENAEESVHYALLEHPAPRRLLLIGGGVNGSLGQALQHRSLQRIDYVEIDPTILEIARRYFPEASRSLADPRVHIHLTDGRLFLKETNLAFDVVIVNLPEPQTAQLNRFYTAEFFREAAAKMTPDGVLSFHLTASENYVSPDLAQFLKSINRTLSEAFPEVVTLPGEAVHFFAARRPGILVRDAGILLERMRERRLTTNYVREYYLPFRMSPGRMKAFVEQIRPDANTRVDRDFEPVAYYFDTALWSSRFNPFYSRFFRSIAGVAFTRLALAAGLLILASAGYARLLRGAESGRRIAAASCAAAMGFTSIGLEVLLLLAFQAIYGSMYQQLALLIGAFMAGMALGSWLAVRGRAGGDMRALSWLQAGAAVAPVMLCAFFALQSRIGAGAGLHQQFPFLIAALLCGALGGFEFPIASRIFFSSGKRRGIGTLYALDLAGSCLGALLFSAYLIPVFGFLRTAALAGEVNLAALTLAWAVRDREHHRA